MTIKYLAVATFSHQILVAYSNKESNSDFKAGVKLLMHKVNPCNPFTVLKSRRNKKLNFCVLSNNTLKYIAVVETVSSNSKEPSKDLTFDSLNSSREKLDSLQDGSNKKADRLSSTTQDSLRSSVSMSADQKLQKKINTEVCITLKTVDFSFRASYDRQLSELDDVIHDSYHADFRFSPPEIEEFEAFTPELEEIVEKHNEKILYDVQETQAIQKEIEEAGDQMVLRIKEALDRGENIGALKEKSSLIEEKANMFKKNTETVSSASWWYRNRTVCLFGVGVVGFLGVVLLVLFLIKIVWKY